MRVGIFVISIILALCEDNNLFDMEGSSVLELNPNLLENLIQEKSPSVVVFYAPVCNSAI
jgi:hypothetical protein